jgi:signal transduction histidine kinase
MDKILDKEIQYNKLQILGKLAASLAHEIRNPLSALKLNLDFLSLSSEQLNNEEGESLKACIESVERIQALIENTLDFSRHPTKDFNLYSLNDVIKQALEIVESEAKRKNVIIEENLFPALPYINLNRNMILQVVLNLITNAMDASESQDRVIIRTCVSKEPEEYICLEVEDTGVGIRDEDKDNIFIDFYTSKEEGTGLGLSVCKMLLNQHKAIIDFKSIEGKGTTFFVKFPKLLIEDYNET